MHLYCFFCMIMKIVRCIPYWFAPTKRSLQRKKNNIQLQLFLKPSHITQSLAIITVSLIMANKQITKIRDSIWTNPSFDDGKTVENCDTIRAQHQRHVKNWFPSPLLCDGLINESCYTTLTGLTNIFRISLQLIWQRTAIRFRPSIVSACKRWLWGKRWASHFQSFRRDMFFSVSFFITFATAISKSSWVTCTLLSRRANIPASVQTACKIQSGSTWENHIYTLCICWFQIFST